MNNEFWDDEELFEDEDELTRPDKKGKVRSHVKKRKWREIETKKSNVG